MADIPMPPTDGDNKMQEGFGMQRIGLIDQRVAGLEIGYEKLNTAIGHVSSRMDDRFGRLDDKFSAGLEALGQKIADSGKTAWPLLISIFMAAFTFTSAMGYLTLQPIKDRQAEQGEYIKDLRAQMVPRAELLEKALANDKTAEFIRNTSAERYKIILEQIDDLRKQYRDLYGAPKMLEALDARLRAMESRGMAAALPAWDTRAERR